LKKNRRDNTTPAARPLTEARFEDDGPEKQQRRRIAAPPKPPALSPIRLAGRKTNDRKADARVRAKTVAHGVR
jgi:hypothetical protein